VFGDAAQMNVRARGKIDHAIAVRAREPRDLTRLLWREPSARRAHANDPAVAR